MVSRRGPKDGVLMVSIETDDVHAEALTKRR